MENNMKINRQKILEYINSLRGYEGYVQFSHRPISKDQDIFFDGKNIKVEDESGFIYEAHFCNNKESIQIRQINDSWLVSKIDILNVSGEDTQTYISDIEKFPYKVKMAQIWKDETDELCENMKAKKLKKVVFAGFEGASK